MRRVLILLALALTACSEQVGQAQASAPVKNITMPSWQANWDVNKETSFIKFSSVYGGEAFDGFFADFTAHIKFDESDLANSKLIAIIDLISADAGEIERTDALPGKEWFYVKSFPKAKFESRKFSHIGGNKFEVQGDLTLRGITKPLTFPFTLHVIDSAAKMNADFTLNRRDYNVGTGMWKSESDVAHKVSVNIEINASKAAP